MSRKLSTMFSVCAGILDFHIKIPWNCVLGNNFDDSIPTVVYVTSVKAGIKLNRICEMLEYAVSGWNSNPDRTRPEDRPPGARSNPFEREHVCRTQGACVNIFSMKQGCLNLL